MIKKTIIKLSLIFFSLIFSIVLVEFLARLFLNKIDYLMPDIYSDYRLGHIIQPFSAGHDKRGFRNNKEMDNADIVALGDSLTYGFASLSTYSWPAILSKISHKDVYNMGVGGYGPIQYYYLLNNYALQLRPKIIIIGLFIGNDLLDTYNMIYDYEYWDKFKNEKEHYNNKYCIGEKSRYINIVDIMQKDAYSGNITFGRYVRDYLAHTSILYRIITNSIIGDIFRKKEVMIDGSKDQDVVILGGEYQTAFKPSYLYKYLDLSNDNIKEGLDKSLFLLNEMNMICRNNQISLIVLLLPTKESVYSELIRNGVSNKLLLKCIENYFTISKEMIDYMEKNNIKYIDLLPIMKENIAKKLYFTNLDIHPNKEGNYIIAQKIYDYLIENKYIENGQENNN
jgi:lysophospholipase L1-like esterase